MNIRTISKQTGLSGDTIRRAVKKVFPGKLQKGKPTDLSDTECEMVKSWLAVHHGVLVNLAYNKTSANAEATSANAEPNDLDAQFKLAIVTLTSMVGGLDSRMTHIEKRIEERAALLPAPQKSDRAAFNQHVRDYAVKMNLNYNTVYGKVYSEMYYRLSVNVKTRAENDGIKPLDWIEANGYMAQALAIATEILR